MQPRLYKECSPGITKSIIAGKKEAVHGDHRKITLTHEKLPNIIYRYDITKKRTCVGFDDLDAAYPRLNIMPFPPKLMTLENPEASTFSQASHVSSSPVKRACSP